MSNQSSGNQTRRRRQPASTIRLLAAAPDLADFLTSEECAEADRIALPMVRLAGPAEISRLLEDAKAFAALVVDGMLLRQLRIGEQPTLRLFGPSELVATGLAPTSTLLVQSDWRAVDPSHLALLGIEFLAAARRWPRLIAGLQARMADSQERLATQLAICQLPRVQDRILAMLWLLAESWGRVTSAGTALSLSLTHESLGALVGARRPTVTLALRELTEQGALVHQDQGWLLLEPPPQPPPSETQLDPPRIVAETASPWSGATPDQPSTDETRAMLCETLTRLREEHRRSTEHHRAIVAEMLEARDYNADIRRRIRDQLAQDPPSHHPSER
jgi:CRP/FNR family cyclic AMP-dependent transcriptional regulator